MYPSRKEERPKRQESKNKKRDEQRELESLEKHAGQWAEENPTVA